MRFINIYMYNIELDVDATTDSSFNEVQTGEKGNKKFMLIIQMILLQEKLVCLKIRSKKCNL